MRQTILAVVCFCLAALAIAAVQSNASHSQQAKQGSNTKIRKVGTRPGDIGKSVDYLKTARERGNDLALVGSGCFWCTEGEFRKVEGVVATAVGFSGGRTVNPTYKEVCTGTTGHVEVTLIEFDPKVISYRQVIEKFFATHDPTQGNRQGPDVGEQYRSVIFTFDDNQAKIAKEVMDEVAKSGKWANPITTEIAPAKPFYMAEDYHQQYYEKQGIVGACPVRRINIA
jgi:peptide-methionine (S)-S-oxide reductase